MTKKVNPRNSNITLTYAGIVSIISGVLIHLITAFVAVESNGFKFAIYTLPFVASILGYFIYWGFLSLQFPSVEMIKEENAFNRAVKDLRKKANKLSDGQAKNEVLARINEMEVNRINQLIERATEELKTSKTPSTE